MQLQWLALFALVTSACSATVDDVSDDVAVVQQALGGFTEIVNFGTTGEVLDIGPTYTVFARWDGCDVIDVVMTTTGAALQVPALPGCANVLIGSSQAGVFVADRSSRAIYMLGLNPTRWIAVVNTTGSIVYSVKDDSTNLYWHDGSQVRRIYLPTLAASPGTKPATDLLAVDGAPGESTVFSSSHTGNGTFYLDNSWWFAGSPMITSYGQTTEPYAKSFSTDPTHLYWVSLSGNAIRRKLRSREAPITNIKSSSTETFFVPVSTGSALYWVDKRTSNGATFLRRRNLSNGNQTAVSFPFAPPNFMRILADGLYFPNYDATAGWSLYRTQR
jgi:hypothetical protein